MFYRNLDRRTERVYSDDQRDALLVEVTGMIIREYATYAELAKASGVSPVTLAAWVGGTTRCARSDTLGKVLRAMGARLVIVSDDKPN